MPYGSRCTLKLLGGDTGQKHLEFAPIPRAMREHPTAFATAAGDRPPGIPKRLGGVGIFGRRNGWQRRCCGCGSGWIVRGILNLSLVYMVELFPAGHDPKRKRHAAVGGLL